MQLHRLFCPSRYWVTNRQELVLIGIGMDIQTITNERNKSLLPEQEMNILSAKTDENFLVDPFLGSGKERFKRR